MKLKYGSVGRLKQQILFNKLHFSDEYLVTKRAIIIKIMLLPYQFK